VIKAAEIVKLGLENLEQQAPEEGVSPQISPALAALLSTQEQMPKTKRPSMTARYINPLRAPKAEELKEEEAYLKALAEGALAGGAGGTLAGVLARRNPIPYLLMGAGTGGIGGLVRRFDVGADPPGLSPVYTIPAGARLGALTGALSGAALGRLSRFGVVPGALTGTLAGGLGGAVASPWI